MKCGGHVGFSVYFGAGDLPLRDTLPAHTSVLGKYVGGTWILCVEMEEQRVVNIDLSLTCAGGSEWMNVTLS